MVRMALGVRVFKFVINFQLTPVNFYGKGNKKAFGKNLNWYFSKSKQ